MGVPARGVWCLATAPPPPTLPPGFAYVVETRPLCSFLVQHVCMTDKRRAQAFPRAYVARVPCRGSYSKCAASGRARKGSLLE